MHINKIKFDKNIIKNYDVNCPRYTSYPTAIQFINYTKKYNIKKIFLIKKNFISIYIHIPFCKNLCYYCACNKIITKNINFSDYYLTLIKKEIKIKKKYLNYTKNIKQIHIGGGTPNFLNQKQIIKLITIIKKYFKIKKNIKEFSIEIDSRNILLSYISLIKNLKFFIISIGIQDLNKNVQKDINRIQKKKEIIFIIKKLRNEKFKSLNIDLIYGLPNQTTNNFIKTIKKIIIISPDKISLFNYAHLPHKFSSQKRINIINFPSPKKKLNILKNTINLLLKAEYSYIGMDHFAKKNNKLTIAQKNNTLYRNFQGYSTNSDCYLFGFGVSAINLLENNYIQNIYSINKYKNLLKKNYIPINKIIILSKDDKIRKYIINNLMCNLKINFQIIKIKFNINFKTYFEKEINKLQIFEKDKLIIIKKNSIIINLKGRFLIRNICSIFDKYHKNIYTKITHSKSI
ncbi:MAG TPA: oxygen-independent coproporphyrinogen III oxidase [Candidatus Azosocius sp. HAIN]